MKLDFRLPMKNDNARLVLHELAVGVEMLYDHVLFEQIERALDLAALEFVRVASVHNHEGSSCDAASGQ